MTTEQLESLVGYTITQVEIVQDFGDEWPVLIGVSPSGDMVQIEVARDEEGNGPGCLFITKLER